MYSGPGSMDGYRMEKLIKLILSIVAASLLLGLILGPAIVIIGGGLLWFFILLIVGGAEDGNPYRTWIRSGRPLEIGAPLPPQVVAKKVPYDRTMLWSFFIAGDILVAIGIIWMMALGTF